MLKRILTEFCSLKNLKPAIDFIVKKKPKARLLFNQAELFYANGNFAGAKEKCLETIKLSPDHEKALHLLGKIEGQQGNYQLAQSYLAKALTLHPALIEAHTDLGNVFKLTGRSAEAIQQYEIALSLQPDHLLALNNLGICYQEQGQLTKVKAYLDQAIRIQPGFSAALKNWVKTLDQLEQYVEARKRLEEIISQYPDYAEAYGALGFIILKRFLEPKLALGYFEKALSLGLNEAETLMNYGIALQDTGEIEQAIHYYNQSIALNPDNHPARFHRGLAQLLKGEFTQGWIDYEARLLSQEHQIANKLPYPAWDGKLVKTVLIYAEQGLGDQLMFASCIPEVLTRTENCVITCNNKLTPIFRRSFPKAKVYSTEQFSNNPHLAETLAIDAQLPIGSLPLLFRKTITEFPAHQGYLYADPTAINHWQTLLNELGEGLKIGISWQGGTEISRSALRSLTLQQLLPILTLNNAHFINLQYTHSEPELQQFYQDSGIKIHHWQAAIEDYDQTAALVSALDLVISVCTAVIHLGGALGKPVWIMAPYIPEWRYGVAGDTMPWYPSVKVFRQGKLGDWPSVIHQVEQALTTLINSPDSA